MATAVDSQCTAAAIAPTAGVDNGDGKALIYATLVGVPPDANVDVVDALAAALISRLGGGMVAAVLASVPGNGARRAR